MKYEIRDAGDPRKYWIQIPNIIDDMDLSVYAFRLYCHLKRVAGDEGKCWQSVCTLATSTGMSKGMIVKARHELLMRKLIAVEREKRKEGGYDSIIIAIVDIWDQNMQTYSQSEPASSPHELAISPHELASSHSGIKEEPLIKNNPTKNNAEQKPKPKPQTVSGGRVFKEYQENIGALTSMISEKLQDLEEDYTEGWVIDAMRIAVQNEHRNLGYIHGILKRWKTNGKSEQKKIIEPPALERF